jgi:hypothetical protein
MKNLIFKTVGALCFFSALSSAATYADAALNGKESKLAKDFDSVKTMVREKRASRKAAKAAEKESEVS